MSNSDKEKVFNHLQNSGVGNFCSACNKYTEWKQANIATVPAIAGKKLDTSRGIPLVTLICKNCGYIRFFSAKAMGLF
jgi:predicted nucleic-acid-binding Zn-ribbon protein